MRPTYEPRMIAGYRLLYGGIAALWLWLFLTPMQQLGLLTGVRTFVPVFVVLWLAQALPYRIMRVIAGLGVSVWYILHYFASPSLTGWASVRALFLQEWLQIHNLRVGAVIRDPLQTQVFLLIIVCIYWLVAYSSTRLRLWVFYNILAVGIYATIDGNTNVHPNQALMFQLVLFLCVLGLTQYQRMTATLMLTRAPQLKYFVPLSALLGSALFIGVVLPKQPAVWANPLLVFEGGGGSGRVTQVIGYQSNASRLGGSFVMNHTPVLSIVAKSPTYLRGQTYSIYTGKGWKPGPTDLTQTPLNSGLPNSGTFASSVKSQLVTQHITVLNSIHAPVLFGAYAISKVTTDSKLDHDYVLTNPRTGGVFATILTKGVTYSVVSREMEFPSTLLSQLPPLPVNTKSAFPASIVATDLNLPYSLPKRVHMLAKQLTVGDKTEYQMVQSIENYLKGNYPYETKGIPVPASNQDYVDQFLFESKKGYCNNFSSSMAVLLRTIGIPTRWVTGFAPGKMDPNYKGSEERFVVENSDAHSWVEVYFPHVGWIPFDPTPNFYMTFAQAQSQDAGSTTSSPTPPVHIKKPPIQPQQSGASAGTSAAFPWGQILLWVRNISIGLVVLLVLVAAFFRRRLREFRHQFAWRGRGPLALSKAVLHLMTMLKKYGELPTEAGTVRDLTPVAKSYGIDSRDYQHFVRTTEMTWYGDLTPAAEDEERVRKTWRDWILRILRRG